MRNSVGLLYTCNKRKVYLRFYKIQLLKLLDIRITLTLHVNFRCLYFWTENLRPVDRTRVPNHRRRLKVPPTTNCATESVQMSPNIRDMTNLIIEIVWINAQLQIVQKVKQKETEGNALDSQNRCLSRYPIEFASK